MAKWKTEIGIQAKIRNDFMSLENPFGMWFERKFNYWLPHNVSQVVKKLIFCFVIINVGVRFTFGQNQMNLNSFCKLVHWIKTKYWCIKVKFNKKHFSSRNLCFVCVYTQFMRPTKFQKNFGLFVFVCNLAWEI